MATATTSDGIAINYTIHGNERADARKLVLVHSLGMNSTVWEWVIDRLVPHTTVLTLDCRGHGASTRPSGPYRLETFASDLADVLDHAGWERCYLAGGSMGGNVSLQFAILHPSRLLGLGLIDTTAWYGADAQQRWEQRAKEAEEKGLSPLIDFQESRWFTDGFRAARSDHVERCRSVFLANDPACFAATCRMLGSFDLRAGLPGLRVPTAVLVGEEDYATPPAMAREIQSGIPGATIQVIPGARHLTFVEYPGVVADALTGLLSRAD